MSIQFTESEWLIMSSLAYCVPNNKFDASGRPLPGTIISVESLLNQLEKQAKGKDFEKANFKTPQDKENYLNAIKSLKEKLKDGNYIVSKSVNHNRPDQSGFQAFAIEPSPNPEKEVIICCRGSDGMTTDTLNDWVYTNAALAFDVQSMQQKEMEEFMTDFEDYNSIDLVGHSLGGNLAMYGAITFKDPSKIRNVYSFDGPGFNQEFVKKYKEKINILKDKIHNYQNEHDLVSSSLVSVGTVIILENSIDDDGNLVNHNRWSIRVNKDGTLKRNESQKKDWVCNCWHEFTKDISKKCNSIVMQFVEGFLAGVFSGVNTLINKFKEWKFKRTAGYESAVKNPVFSIDTDKMIQYSKELSIIAKKAEKLDSKMNSLYSMVGLEFDSTVNLGKLAKAGRILDDSRKIKKCSKFLDDTANRFDRIEKDLKQHLG